MTLPKPGLCFAHWVLQQHWIFEGKRNKDKTNSHWLHYLCNLFSIFFPAPIMTLLQSTLHFAASKRHPIKGNRASLPTPICTCVPYLDPCLRVLIPSTHTPDLASVVSMSAVIAQGRADQLQVLWWEPRRHLQFQQLFLILQQNHSKSVVQTLPPYEEQRKYMNNQKKPQNPRKSKEWESITDEECSPSP